MQIIHLNSVAERETRSPLGKYQAFMKEVSLALGREPRSLDMRKRHPFDLAVVRVPPGTAHCPYHAHSAQYDRSPGPSIKPAGTSDHGRSPCPGTSHGR